MKKLFLLAAASVAIFTANAQYLSKGDNVVSATIGLGNTIYSSSYDSRVPPISLNYEYGLMEDAFEVQGMTLGVGGVFAYTSAKLSYTYFDEPYGYKFMSIIVAAKGYVHYDVMSLFDVHVDKLDTYAALTLGYNISSSKKWGDWTHGTNANNSYSGLIYGFQIGARYWFTDSLAANLELGYGLSYLNLGISYKF